VDWPDLRDLKLLGLPVSDKKENFMIAWCHGASGIGFSRLKSLGALDDPEIREEIDTA
jgi:lantibiotic modifying enzyme